MLPGRSANSGRGQGRWWSMRIGEQHVAELGLVVLDITAADEDTLRAALEALQQQWATSGVTAARRLPGEPGVRARVYADVYRPGARWSQRARPRAAPAHVCSPARSTGSVPRGTGAAPAVLVPPSTGTGALPVHPIPARAGGEPSGSSCSLGRVIDLLLVGGWRVSVRSAGRPLWCPTTPGHTSSLAPAASEGPRFGLRHQMLAVDQGSQRHDREPSNRW